MRPGQNFYCAQQQQQVAQQAISGFRPGHQPQPIRAFPSPLYAGPHSDLHSGVQVVTLPLGAVAQQYAVTPIPPPPQQWEHLREPHSRGNGHFPSQVLGPPFHGQQFVHHEPNVAFIPPQHHRGNGLRGPPRGYGHDGPGGRFDRDPMYQDLRPSAGGMRHMEHPPHERVFRGSSRDESHDDNRSASWSSGCGSSIGRNMFGGNKEEGRGGGMNREPVRSQAVSLRCEPCDRTFTSAQQFAAHKSTHVKCDMKDCSFEASGRVVKEHKQTCHNSSSASTPSRPGLFKSKESEEEILRWREERRRNYPTTANIKHKAEEMQARKARGELVDEDARKRRERLKEILARQAELGVPVAEVPSYYFSDRYGALKGKGDNASGSRKGNNRGAKKRHAEQANTAIGTEKGEGSEPLAKQARIDEFNISSPAEPVRSNLESEAGEVRGIPPEKAEQSGEAVTGAAGPNAGGKRSSRKSKQWCYFYERGRCRKGSSCEFLHEKKPRKDAGANATKRQPSLLFKLLEPEMRREKSRMLQSFRFLVNNKFLLQYPEKPLKFLEWTDIEEQSTSDVEVARLDRKIQELQAVIEDTMEDENEEADDGDSSSEPGEEGQNQQDIHLKLRDDGEEVIETQT